MSSQPCTLATCDVSDSPYGYRPSPAAAAVFAAVSSACLVLNAAVTARTTVHRQQHTRHPAGPFAILITLACVLEMLGWVDRLAGWRDPWAVYPFMQSTALLTITPVFVTSSIYLCLGPMTRILGSEHSILKPELYAAVFLPLDGLALLLQIAGLVLGFKDVPIVLTSEKNALLAVNGAKIITAGLAIQLATLSAAGLLLASVLLRAARAHRRYGYTTFHRDVGYTPLTGRFRALATVVPSAMVVLLGRLAFRVSEYAKYAGNAASDGEGGKGLFLGLEGFLVAYALVAVVGCHPALFLRDGKRVSRIETELFVGIDVVGGRVTGDGGVAVDHQAHLEELSKAYQAHHEEEQRLARFERA